jgi:phage tail sheath protein FI
MPEYLAPGVYVEETSFRSKSIEGVSTTTTGFIGPCRFGPLDIEPDVITSLGEFERAYGGRERLNFSGAEMDGYLWHAARAFFEEGGKRLYVSRVFRAPEGLTTVECCSVRDVPLGDTPVLHLRARYPGVAGDFRVQFSVRLGQNVLVRDHENVLRLRGVQPFDVVMVEQDGSADVYLALYDDRTETWSFSQSDDGTPSADLVPADGQTVRRITLTVAVDPLTGDNPRYVAADLALDRRHTQAGTPDSLLDHFQAEPPNLPRARLNPLVIEAAGTSEPNGLEVLSALRAESAASAAGAAAPRLGLDVTLFDPNARDAERTLSVTLDNGSDGLRPGSTEYEGTAPDDSQRKTGLKQFEDIEDISIVAAPGSTFGYGTGDVQALDSQSIVGLLISHCQRMRYRIAVVDSGDGQTISEVRAMRARIDSSYGAMYYPWVRVVDPLTRQEIALPPSGFVAGIYARNDINRAVWKAPANEVVNLAIGFEQTLNKSQQDVLNPEGINCFRYFHGRGNRLWGARTVSSDPEWKYVNLRRYFAYLERSIDRGTQWAVFEPNGEALWENVRRTIYDFLLNEWVSGALLGEKPEKAFFVKCDRSTMTQNDLDNGRLICLIGVAPLRPAEFVIFRVGQWTSDRKV